jgi:hypothetical protein
MVKEMDNPPLPSLRLQDRPWFCGRQTTNLSAVTPDVGMGEEATPGLGRGSSAAARDQVRGEPLYIAR